MAEDNIEVRFERPEYISITPHPRPREEMLEIAGIAFEGDLKEGECVPPNVVLLPDYPVLRRDEALGRYIASWNRLERKIDLLIQAAMQKPQSQSSAIFDLGLNISQIINFIKSQAVGLTDEGGFDCLCKWLGTLQKLNLVRNRIIHADWICQLMIGADDQGRPIVSSWRWARIYTPADIDERKKAKANDPKMKRKYERTIAQIIQAGRDAEAHARAMSLQDFGLPPPQFP